MYVIDLGLTNADLYADCEITEVGGRLNLVTPVQEAANTVGRNINKMVASVPREERDTVKLTGPMAVWAYLIVFHAVVHAFTKVVYDDGRSGEVLIAAHGA